MVTPNREPQEYSGKKVVHSCAFELHSFRSALPRPYKWAVMAFLVLLQCIYDLYRESQLYLSHQENFNLFGASVVW